MLTQNELHLCRDLYYIINNHVTHKEGAIAQLDDHTKCKLFDYVCNHDKAYMYRSNSTDGLIRVAYHMMNVPWESTDDTETYYSG